MLKTITISLLIFTLVIGSSLTAQDTSLKVYVHDNYTEQPLESVLVSILQNGVVIDSAYTDASGIANLRTVTSVREPEGLPTSLSLSHNYPNPFRDETKIDLGIPGSQTITAAVYNILGQRVVSEQMQLSGGYYTLNISLAHLPTGVYFLRIDGRETRAVKLLKMGGVVHPSGPVFSISIVSLPGRASVGKVAEDAYLLRAQKDRYDVYEATLSIPENREVIVPFARNNIVEFVVVDRLNNPVAKQVELKLNDYQTMITTPHTLSLKSGVYKAVGEVEQGISLEHTVEIPSVDTTVVLTFEQAGVKLEGSPDAPAIDATYDLDIPIVYSGEAISVDPDFSRERRILRTEIEVVLNPDVTITDVNGMLEKYNADIVSMLEGNTIFIIKVPDPGDVASLDQLVDDIKDEEIVLSALKSFIMGYPEPLYENEVSDGMQKVPGHVIYVDNIDHHLAVRAHAAWNLQGAITGLSDRPWIVIGDFFGAGVPGSGYNASFTKTDFTTVRTNSHGYHVLGIISGMHDKVEGLSAFCNDVTGIFPERLQVRAADMRGINFSWPRAMNVMIMRIKDIYSSDGNANVILNTSLGDTELLMEHAFSWIQRVRGSADVFSVGAGFEHAFIHFTAAGNKPKNRATPMWAIEDSPFAYAALGRVLSNGVDVPNLTNIFAVENRLNTMHNYDIPQRPLPGCAADRSCVGGNISAMGTEVWSFGDRSGSVHYADSHASDMSGTSMATPQAAGVAAYVWAVNPNLSAAEVMDIIRSTAEERATNTLAPEGFTCNEVVPQPVIDAYAAVLFAGGADARRALLDLKGNRIFDQHDLEEFVLVYDDTLQTGKLDYSRYDLNGDGITGGSSTDRFDLNMDGRFTEAAVIIRETPIILDENKLTDIDILCYYAYSNLYVGDLDARKILDGLCALIDIDGNVYRTVRIGEQLWMGENLKVSRYRNGDFIPTGLDSAAWRNTTSGAYAIYPHIKIDGLNSDEEVVNAYGLLYNWFAVVEPRGLCPAGWHVPGDDEWKQLEIYLGMSQEDADQKWGRGHEEAVGNKLKSTRTSDKSSKHPRWDYHPSEKGTDESGFAGLPGGARNYYKSIYHNVGSGAYWWSSTEFDNDRAWMRQLSYIFRSVDRPSERKQQGNSVRCLRDD